MPWRVNGLDFRIDPNIRRLIPHQTEEHLFEFFRQHIRPGEIVIDVGSFLGIYPMHIARCVGSTGHVFAFEPTRTSYSILCQQLSWNGLESRVTPFCAALGEVAGPAKMSQHKEEPYRNALADPRSNASDEATVDMLTLDAFCDQRRIQPDWIRMDVQGYEFHVLRGARQLLKQYGKKLRIVVEVHPQCWDQVGMSKTKALEFFEELGLISTPVIPNRGLFEIDGHLLLEKAK